MNPIYIRNFLDESCRHALFGELLSLPWLEIKNARKEFFMSDVPRTYVYDKGGYEYASCDFIPVVAELLPMLGGDYNVCFLNRYDHQHHALGWHADDSPNVDPAHPIGVVSIGAERELWWKCAGYKGEIPDENKQVLDDGSLFVMPAHFQEGHLHKIPKHDRVCGVRMSLTFRKYI